MASSRSLTFDTEELSNVAMSVLGDDKPDLLDKKLPLCLEADRINGAGKPSKDGGRKWLQPVEVIEHSDVTGMPTGYEEVLLDIEGTDRTFVFEPGYASAPIVFTQVDKNTYTGEAAFYDYVGDKVKGVARMMKRKWHVFSLAGTGAGFLASGWNHLNGTDDTNGYVEEEAHGSQGNTVGGLSKSTLSGVAGMNNWSYDMSDLFGSNGREGVRTIINNVREYGDAEGLTVLASRAGMLNAQRVMEPYMQYKPGDTPDLYSPDVLLMGAPIHQTEDMPIGGTNTSASPWSLLLLDLKGIFPVWLRADTDGHFGITDFREVGGGHRGVVAFIDCNGQWCVKKFHSTGLIHSGETF